MMHFSIFSQGSRLFAIALMALLGSSCGGNGSTTTPVQSDSSGNQTGNNSPQTGNTSPQNPPAPELISRADTSELLDAIAQGLDPQTTLVSTNFYCYEKAQVATSSPSLLLTISGNSISSNEFTDTIVGPADDGILPVISADGDAYNIYLELSDYGQILTFSYQAPIEACYQSGAAHEFAMHKHLLNTPQPGAYSCAAGATNNPSTLVELIDQQQYRANGQIGRYEYDGVTSSNYSEVQFNDGPLQGAEAEYYEDPQTGLQTLDFYETSSQSFFNGSGTSSSSLTTVCSKRISPRPFKQYGEAKAPVATAPTVALEGLYFMDTSVLTTTERTDSANYIEFKPSGYVFVGLPAAGGTDCTRTKPSGLPICSQYSFDGSNFSGRFWGGVVEEYISVTVNTNRQVTSFYDYPTELITPFNAADIVGSWESQDVESSGLTLCLVGICNSSITDRTIHFRGDGQYLFQSSSESMSSTDLGSVQSFFNGSNSDQTSGSYAINGNRITLNGIQGTDIELPVYITNDGRLVLGELQYFLM